MRTLLVALPNDLTLELIVGAALGAYAFEPGEQDALLAFGAHVESCRQWGREQRAALGL